MDIKCELELLPGSAAAVQLVHVFFLGFFFFLIFHKKSWKNIYIKRN